MKAPGLAKIQEKILLALVSIRANDLDDSVGRAEIQAKICVNLRHAHLFREIRCSLAIHRRINVPSRCDVSSMN